MKKKLIALFVMVMAAMPLAFADEMNGADIAWVSIASALVMLMTPAVSFFYAGLVRQKNMVSILAQSMAIFAIVSIVWTVIGYSLAFAPSVGGVIGDLSFFGLNGVGFEADGNYAATIPALLFYFFQLMFATITPALIIGSFAERINFKALLAFVVFWSVLVYAPIAHWIWNPGGWLRGLGALDFAGGTVVHAAAGLSALAAAMVIGRRMAKNSKVEFKPSNVPFVVLGAALLWFGWFGFNAGSALASGTLAVSALVVTNIAAAAGAVSWMVVDWIVKGKPSAVGLSIGAVCGLVAITPASGFVSTSSAILIGAIAGVISNLVANWRAARTRLDDSLDVFACHGVSGVFGALATGIFASKAINPAGADGLIHGNWQLIVSQFVACGVVIAYAFVVTFLLMKVISMLVPLRVSQEDEEAGLDISHHGESAFN